jgi:hypothetical protein
MDELTVAQVLPERYREVLERVASLESLGHRREAGILRRDAIRVYSRSWDGRAIRSMENLRTRADRVIQGGERPRQARPEHPAVRSIRLRLLRVSA